MNTTLYTTTARLTGSRAKVNQVLGELALLVLDSDVELTYAQAATHTKTGLFGTREVAVTYLITLDQMTERQADLLELWLKVHAAC